MKLFISVVLALCLFGCDWMNKDKQESKDPAAAEETTEQETTDSN